MNDFFNRENRAVTTPPTPPSQGGKKRRPPLRKGGKTAPPLARGGKTAQRNRHESAACSRPTLHRAGAGPGVSTDRVECRSPQAHNELASRRENDGEAVFPPSSSGRLPLPAESGCPDSRPLRSHRLKPT